MTIGLAEPYVCFQCEQDYEPRFEWKKDDKRTWFCSGRCWAKYNADDGEDQK